MSNELQQRKRTLVDELRRETKEAQERHQEWLRCREIERQVEQYAIIDNMTGQVMYD